MTNTVISRKHKVVAVIVAESGGSAVQAAEDAIEAMAMIVKNAKEK